MKLMSDFSGKKHIYLWAETENGAFFSELVISLVKVKDDLSVNLVFMKKWLKFLSRFCVDPRWAKKYNIEIIIEYLLWLIHEVISLEQWII